ARLDRSIVLAITLTVLIIWLASVRWGDFLPWQYVFEYVPGAKAIRVPPRYQILVGFFAVLTVTLFLDRSGWFDNPVILAGIATFLLVEQYNLSYGWGQVRKKENWEFTEIPSPPARCRSFFVVHPEPRPSWPPPIRAAYAAATDGMIIAERFNLPTLNGF